MVATRKTTRRQPAPRKPAAHAASGDPVAFSAQALDGVDTVIIDIGDTLLPTGKAYSIATRVLYDGLAKDSRLPVKDVADGLLALPCQELLTLPYGLNQHAGLREKFPGVDLVERFAPLRQRMTQTLLDNAAADHDSVDFLKRLKQQGRRVILMTGMPESAARLVVRGAGLAGLADRIYAGPDIEPDSPPADSAARPANNPSLAERMALDTSEPVRVMPPGLDPRQQLAHVLAVENIQPAQCLRIADNPRQDIAPANELGLRTVLATQHHVSGDTAFIAPMRRLRQGSGTVQPPRILPPMPPYEPAAGMEQPQFLVRSSQQLLMGTDHAHAAQPDQPGQPASALPIRPGQVH